MPHWHFALCWWLASGALSFVFFLQGRFVLALTALGVVALGFALLIVFREHGRAVYSSKRLAFAVFACMLVMGIGLVSSADHLQDLKVPFIAFLAASVPTVWLFTRLSRELSGKIPPN